MVNLHSTDGPLATAQKLASFGFNVLPARFKDKAPIVPWTKYQDTRTEKNLASWFGNNGNRNFWGMTGRMSGIVVIDCDNDAGEAWWRERIGDLMTATTKVSTRKGHHYYFRIPDDWDADKIIASWSVHPKQGDTFDESFDVRADGTGVVLPPSTHETGHVYRWVDCDPEDPRANMVEAPRELLMGTYREQAPQGGGVSGTATRKGSGGVTRSMLSSLLQNPPGGEGSGRNDWLARVAGHYAKTYHNAQDLFTTHCQQANASMADPLDDAEFTKTIESVWKGEHTRNPQRALDEACGWLQDGGYVIMTQVVIKGEDDSREYDLAPYCNFNIKAKGVMVEDDGRRTYWVELLTKRPGNKVDVIDAILPSSALGDDKALRVYFARFGVNILPPENIWPRHATPTIRIQRYLESQEPPVVKIADALGWDAEILAGAGGFITHDGIITATDIVATEDAGVRPNPTLLTGGIAPHAYGFTNDGLEAKRVLREVLTFHEDDITSVFGAWWAACLVKPQIEEVSSLFPFVAIEAPSESGKTNGFFDMMTQLNGNTRGESQSTKAALRDMAAAHKNGIVWIDDMDDPANLMELLRAATSGGTITKMGEDRTSVKNAKIVSPIVLSGEQLGMETQKALIDRAITIHATSPVGRKSLHDPTRAQWDDVLDLREQYPGGLSALAGWLVQDALSQVSNVLASVKEGRRGVAGRAADKIGILRAGARLLDYLVSEDGVWVEGHHSKVVDAYLEKRTASALFAYDNALTLKVIPWALRRFDYPDAPYPKKFDDGVDSPVWVRQPSGVMVSVRRILEENDFGDGGPEIWFSPSLLAEAWEKHKHGRVDRRTESDGALKQQAAAIKGMGPGKQWKVRGTTRKPYYQVLRGDIVGVLLARAEGTE